MGGEGIVYFTLSLRDILAYSTQVLFRIRLVPGNVVIFATDMYGKSPHGSGYTELRESTTFLPFLFSFLITNFYNFCYILLSPIVLTFAEILF